MMYAFIFKIRKLIFTSKKLLCALLLVNFSLPNALASKEEPAYLIVSGWYKDSEVASSYMRSMLPIISQYGKEASLAGIPGVNLNVLEGTWMPRMTLLIKFSSKENIKDFWWSDAYRDAVKIRQNYAELDVVLAPHTPNVPSDFSDESAFLMFFATVVDREKLRKEYIPFAPKVVKKYGGEFVIWTKRAQLEELEGDWPDTSLIVLEFPNTKKLRAFWNDKEYKKLTEIRKTTGKWSAIELTPNLNRATDS